MSTLYNEAEADIEVNKVLNRIRTEKMAQLFIDRDNQICFVKEAEVITRDDLLYRVQQAEEAVARATQAVSEYDELFNAQNATPPEDEPTPQPVVENLISDVQPALVEQEPVPQPEVPVAPVPEQPAPINLG